VAVKLGYKNVFRDPLGYPEWQRMGLPVESRPAGLAGPEARPEAPGPLHGWSMIWTLLGIFFGGIALNLTPCVYPMIPITVSFFGGRAASGATAKGRLVAHGLCYLFGLALTNSALGVAAALTGSLLGAVLQNPVVLVIVATVLVVFAASLFGLWELRLPSRLTQAAATSHTGYFGSLFMGLTLGVIAAPCIGPFVLGLLTWVASLGSPWLGFLVFFTLSMGLGLPLFVLAVFAGQLQKLPRSGGWMLWVRKLMGWVLVGMAVHFLRPILTESAAVWLIAGVALAAGLHLGWLDRNAAPFRAFGWLKTGAGLAGIVLATFLLTSWVLKGPGVVWKLYSEALLAEARSNSKPVVMDFYATWCTPCRELEEITFHDAAVVKLAASAFVMVKVDVTGSDNPTHDRLLREYGIKGVPTVVFLDPDGNERQELRLVDYLSADQMLNRMAQLLRSGG
jgi:thiol:disulfide interchange protein DsbD